MPVATTTIPAVPQPPSARDIIIKSAFLSQQQPELATGEPDPPHDELVYLSDLPDDSKDSAAEEAPTVLLVYGGKRYMLFNASQEWNANPVGRGEEDERVDPLFPYDSSPAMLLSGRDELCELPLSHFVSALKASLDIGDHRDAFIEFPQLELCFVEGREDSKGITLEYLWMMFTTLHRYQSGDSPERSQLQINVWDLPKHAERVNFLENIMLTDKLAEYGTVSDSEDGDESEGLEAGEDEEHVYLQPDCCSDEEQDGNVREEEVEDDEGDQGEEHDEGSDIKQPDNKVVESGNAEQTAEAKLVEPRLDTGLNEEESEVCRPVSGRIGNNNEKKRDTTAANSTVVGSSSSPDSSSRGVASPVSKTSFVITSRTLTVDKSFEHGENDSAYQRNQDNTKTISVNGECALSVCQDAHSRIQSEKFYPDAGDIHQSRPTTNVPEVESRGGIKRPDAERGCEAAGDDEEGDRKRIRL